MKLSARWERRSFTAAIAVASCLLFGFGAGCKRRVPIVIPPVSASGFTIQVGVFSVEENAVRLTRSLKNNGFSASFFRGETGYFKVQVGIFSSRKDAEKAARELLEKRVITEFYVVPRRPEPPVASPSESPAASPSPREALLREDLAGTARSFLEYPYTWGGTSAEEGFDCSGLAMAVYKLNGLELPRSLFAQYQTGRPVSRDALQAGDLVFFATKGGISPTHVGVYAGGGRFIHAPGTGKTVRADSLSSPYYARFYLGARTYF